jgi:prepilin-type N-terminal cleavage/methylation domain-containing protein
MRIKTGRCGGFTIVELMTVVAIIGLLLAIAIPNFVKTRDTSQLAAVYNNLRIIESAKDQWALENKKGSGDSIDLPALSDFLKGGTIKPVVHEVYEVNLIGLPAYATTSVKLGTYEPAVQISIP